MIMFRVEIKENIKQWREKSKNARKETYKKQKYKKIEKAI